jgi:RNA polymerase sigma-70 factor (ECF subfamily)
MIGKLLPFRSVRTRGDDPASLSDEGLVAACAAGDPAAMGLLFDRFALPVHRFLARLLRSPSADVSDMVQATFIEAFRAARRFRADGQVRTWLFGIAVNVGRHHVRGETRRRAFLTAWGEAAPAASLRPDQSAEHRQLMTRLDAALGALPAELRTAFVLCDLEGLAGAEAASVAGVPPGTLGRRLHAARRALRAALEGGPP